VYVDGYGSQRFTSVIPAMQEAKIWRIMVPGQPRQKNLQNPISTEKNWARWHMPVILAMARSINRRTEVQASLGKKRDPISNTTRAKSTGGMTQTVDYLPSKCKTFSTSKN
jgi:hypothetical protein